MSLGVRPLGFFFISTFALLQFGVFLMVYEKKAETCNEKSSHASMHVFIMPLGIRHLACEYGAKWALHVVILDSIMKVDRA